MEEHFLYRAGNYPPPLCMTDYQVILLSPWFAQPRYLKKLLKSLFDNFFRIFDDMSNIRSPIFITDYRTTVRYPLGYQVSVHSKHEMKKIGKPVYSKHRIIIS